jgi:NSS family neurotransmitter:Na+ symporter
MVLAAGTWLVGLSVVLSFNLWSEVRPLGVFEYFADKTIFDLFDFLTANVMMPIGALLLAAFAGWAMQRDSIRQEIGLADGTWYRVWMFLLRFVVPVGIVAILLGNLL